jgi:hypothetical protein
MSYEKMMKWNKKHRKGTKQTVIMHTNSGFIPSQKFSERWIKYANEQEAKGLPYMDIEQYYNSRLP